MWYIHLATLAGGSTAASRRCRRWPPAAISRRRRSAARRRQPPLALPQTAAGSGSLYWCRVPHFFNKGFYKNVGARHNYKFSTLFRVDYPRCIENSKMPCALKGLSLFS
jgi:hypothetical protein